MKYHRNSNINNLIKEKIDQDWRIEQGKHIKLYNPYGGFITISRTPSCPFAFNNIKADVKRLERFNSNREINGGP